jgi:carbonic anhydrase/acetyltransferase-like protein (isoleucine patch superfamily)
MSNDLPHPAVDPSAYIAPTARVFGDVTIGARVVVMFGVVMRAELDRIRIGEETNLQDNVVVHVDRGFPCTIGRRVTIGHAAVVHGATVSDHCLIGIGAVVLNGAVIGEGAWVAAGAVVPEGRTIPPWTIAVGTPARPVREVSEAERARQRDGVAEYLRYADLYRHLAAT